MTSQINLRLDDSLIENLEDLASKMHLDRISLMRKVLLEGLNAERLKFAIQQYIMQEISLERAAEIAQISFYEFIITLDKYNITQSHLEVQDYQDLLNQ